MLFNILSVYIRVHPRFSISFLVVGIHPDGDGAVIGQGDLHVRAELPCGDWFACQFFQFADERFVDIVYTRLTKA